MNRENLRCRQDKKNCKNYLLLCSYRCSIICHSRNFSTDSSEIKKLVDPTKVAPKIKNNDKIIKESKMSDITFWEKHKFYYPNQEYWNEGAAIRRVKRDNSFFKRINNITELMKEIQSLYSLPKSLDDLVYILSKKKHRNHLLKQQYLFRRKAVLKADLAAAHFLLSRGGAVKFVGHSNWTTSCGAVPNRYMPGYNIEAFSAEGTNLCREGLENLTQLRHLTSASFKGLEDINDWCMDWISREFDLLHHLDISDCKNVTHRGLSCFYRFECLKTLNVKGVSDSPEFKVACLMLLEIMPNLEIEGIDLTIPEKIDPVNEKELLTNEQKIKSIQKVQ